MKLSYLPLGLLGLVDLVLFGLVASGEQQHGHALRHSLIRRLSTGTCAGANFIAPERNTVTGNAVDWTFGGTYSLDETNPLYISSLYFPTTQFGIFATLDCGTRTLYLMVRYLQGVFSPLVTNPSMHGAFISGTIFNLNNVPYYQFINSTGGNTIGWEAAISTAALNDCLNTVNIFSTSNDAQMIRGLSMDLTCPTTNNNNGAAFGDPHLKTWKGDVYDFHGSCDLVLLKHLAYASMLGLEIHIRTTIRRDWSYISAAALKIGNDILEVHSGATYYLNGVEGAVLPASLAGFLVTVKAHGQKRHRFTVTLENGCVVVFKVYGDFLAVSVNNAGIDFADSSGMMGSFPNGEFRARDGETVIGDTKEFGLEWQVQQGDPVLFLKPEGPQYPQTCDMPELVDTATGRRHRRLSEESMVSLEEAEEACQFWPEDGRDACVYDVLSTGDLNMAEAGAF